MTTPPPRPTPGRLRGTLAAFLIAWIAATATARGSETLRDLPPGDPERRRLLELLRPVMEREMRGPVEFRVKLARTLRGWGLVRVEPQRPGGSRIALGETVFAETSSSMDGLTTDALFRLRDDRWHLVTHVVGPTDAASSNWLFGDVPMRLWNPDFVEVEAPN